MKKLTNNFYIIKKKKYWNFNQKKIIKKYLNYNIFKNISKKFVDYIFEDYNKLSADVIMFNFDSIRGKKLSLRGIICISFPNQIDNYLSKKEKYKYYTLELIGNINIGKGPSNIVKKKHNISIKSGKNMLKYWINYGKKHKYKYFKVNSMENVIGFYWKYGFRFTKININYDILSNVINRLNYLNNKVILNKFEKEEYNYLLKKYFDKYLKDYYNINYLSNNHELSEINSDDTLNEKRYNLRHYGYPMYYFY